MKRILIFLSIVLGVAVTSLAVIPPKDGSKMPQVFHNIKAKNKGAFMPKRAWINKARRAKAKREAFAGSSGITGSSFAPQDFKVAGSFGVPVLLGNFANTSAPYPRSNLQTELFDGPFSPGTMVDFYDEVSYGNISLSGDVYDWVTVSKNDTYYEGTSWGTVPGDAHTGEFIKELLDANDGSVDFGQYDNDGPDGIPNSGDDDGYVDFIAIVQPEVGAECTGNSNIWSHSWSLSAWPILGYGPYTTNDVCASGGFIKVDDYTIQPALACGGASMIQIGVFCHEFGHAFGLPDLYDTDGGSSGIGHWGLMGSGNWNTPSSPAHFCAWSKVQLGWIIPTEVTWQGAVEQIPQIETNSVCYKLPFTDDRWNRVPECAISGSYSMRCGLSDAEGNARHWDGAGGYGNLWNETVQHDFIFNGSTPVNFSYNYHYETEPTYDFAYVSINVQGSETILKAYDGTGDGFESIDLSSILSAYTPPVRYKLKFRFISDFAWSDEDNDAPTTCGAFVVDDVDVAGGGESYHTGFENHIDGWYQDPASNYTSEYWLVSNRQSFGFDSNVHGLGLLIWHVDDEVMASILGNTGDGDAAGNNTVRGLVLDEADGNWDLLNNVNRGDNGDSYPGITSNTTFDSLSNPSSRDNTDRPTNIEVSSISAPASIMSAYMRAGDFAPDAISVAPDSVDNDQVSVAIQVDGLGMRQGAAFKFTKPGEADIVPDTVIWDGKDQIRGGINVYSKKPGYWRLEVTNPDGQLDSIPNALYLNFIVATQLAFAHLKELEEGSIELKFSLSSLDNGDVVLVKKSLTAAGMWFEPNWDEADVNDLDYRFVDSHVEPGKTYYYRVDVLSPQGSLKNLFVGSTSLRVRELALYQNYPNPFNPGTTISFYLPAREKVNLEIFSVKGSLIARLVDEIQSPGLKSIPWDGRDAKGRPLSSGVYFYRLQAGKRVLTKKMVLIK
jgi:M6 family metalloprotease-like protein